MTEQTIKQQAIVETPTNVELAMSESPSFAHKPKSKNDGFRFSQDELGLTCLTKEHLIDLINEKDARQQESLDQIKRLQDALADALKKSTAKVAVDVIQVQDHDKEQGTESSSEQCVDEKSNAEKLQSAANTAKKVLEAAEKAKDAYEKGEKAYKKIKGLLACLGV